MGSRFQSALKQAELVASIREGVHKGMLNDPPLPKIRPIRVDVQGLSFSAGFHSPSHTM